MSTEEILDLEIKYFKKLDSIFGSSDFLDSLKDIENYIITNYKTIKKNDVTLNIINTPLERLLRYFCYEKIKPLKPYTRVDGSDVCFETADCLFNLDAKTVNLIKNKVDRKCWLIEKNQITFNNNKKYAQKFSSGDCFDGFEFFPSLKPIYKTKPTLTFFYKINYIDDGKRFKIIEHQFYLAPNEIVFRNFFKSHDIINNIKSWGYVGSEKTAKLMGNTNMKPFKNINRKWEHFKPKGQRRNLYFDKYTTNPITKQNFTIRSLKDKKYHVTFSGISARMNYNIIQNNYDEKIYSYKMIDKSKEYKELVL